MPSLARREKVARERLEVLERVDPGASRIRGYETFRLHLVLTKRGLSPGATRLGGVVTWCDFLILQVMECWRRPGRGWWRLTGYCGRTHPVLWRWQLVTCN